MGRERWVQPVAGRYVLLATALSCTVTGVLVAACWASSPEPDLGRARLAFVTVSAPLSVLFTLGYFLERRYGWRVDERGIAVVNERRGQVAFLAWGDMASVRVLPLGWVFAASRSKWGTVLCLAGVSREDANWLREFAREQLR